VYTLTLLITGGTHSVSERRSPSRVHPKRAHTSGLSKTEEDNATIVRDLIQDVLHNPIFNPANVDHNMHDRHVCAVMDDMDVHNMKVEGDGEKDVRFFKHKLEAVLRELLADERLEGCQHFAFKEYKNTNGERINDVIIHIM
jgi:hypothetical protein